MAIISEHGSISRIHESKVIKLRKIRQLRLVARTRKVGYVYRILIKRPEAISSLIMEGI
jgi:hypothetical protein